MKNTLLAIAFAPAIALVACGGVKTRTPDQWRTEVGQGFDGHAAELKACYDEAGLKTKVAITVHLIAGKQEGSSGNSNPISVESVDAGGAPGPLVDCVKRVANAISIRPEDKNEATGSWVVTFDPNVAPTVKATSAPKS